MTAEDGNFDRLPPRGELDDRAWVHKLGGFVDGIATVEDVGPERAHDLAVEAAAEIAQLTEKHERGSDDKS